MTRRETGGGFRRWCQHRIGHSLFLKLLLVLLAAAVLVNLCVGGAFRLTWAGRSHEAARNNVLYYAGLLAREIGSPPDTAKARALASAHQLQIRYEGPGGPWETQPGLATLPRDRRGRHGDDPNLGWSHGRFYVRAAQGEGRFLFATDFHNGEWGPPLWILLSIGGCISLILAGAWMLIRRLLSPIRELSVAVEKLGNGELDSRVQDRCRQDELGDLARAFNAMSSRIRDMVRSREQLLLDVSHELRSPLTRAKVALEMAPEGAARDSIGDDIGEMEAMIGEILEAARLDSVAGRLSPEPVDLRALAAEVTRGFEGQPPGVRLVPEGRGDPGDPAIPERGSPAGEGFAISADRERVRKVLSNVIGNAVKYSRSGKGPVEVAFSRREGNVRVTVRDRGVGIPAAELPRLFEPFYRVDRSRSRDTGGYGLGLSLCKRIMEAHGGAISIASREGEGTSVHLDFPGI